MTNRALRRQRHEESRKHKKQELRRAKAQLSAEPAAAIAQPAPLPRPTPPVTAEPVPSPERPAPAPSHLAARNRRNAAYSTGPRTPAGKLASSLNNFRHGLASGQLLIPGESPSDFAALLDALRAEHQPATPTEDLLVTGMAEHHWLSRRALRLQTELFSAPDLDEKRLSLFLRYETQHTRAFHKCLADLLKLKKENRLSQSGFVSQKPAPSLPEESLHAEIGFEFADFLDLPDRPAKHFACQSAPNPAPSHQPAV